MSMQETIKQGLIVRVLGGFYDVKTQEGAIYSCRARGRFRKDESSPLVGDQVKIEALPDQTGYVLAILPRLNSFLRPPVANVQKLFVVASMAQPAYNTQVLDKLLAVAAYKEIDVALILNKVDLEPPDNLLQTYRLAGIEVHCVCTLSGEGIAQVVDAMASGINVFTGNSGVGKSSILNRIDQTLHLKTGEISEKLGRGRHTTRHVELYELPNGGYLADTPGFSSIEIQQYEHILKDQLQFCFPEFAPYLSRCRFTGCSHTCEKGCAVLAALKEGKIAQSRFDSYCALYEEAKNIKEWQLK